MIEERKWNEDTRKEREGKSRRMKRKEIEREKRRQGGIFEMERMIEG